MVMISCDGGGTKLQVVAFNEKLQFLGTVRGPAITTRYMPLEAAKENCRQTMRALISQMEGKLEYENGLPVIDCVYQSGPSGVKPSDILAEMAVVRKAVVIKESVAGFLAGVGKKEGVLSLSGTGSDHFWIHEGDLKVMVGGYGPVLGDEGSGYDLGRQTLLAAIYADEDRGEPTVLRDYIFADYGLKQCMFDLVDIVYGSVDSRKEVARATYTLARAAYDQDAVALRILADAGKQLAKDAMAVLRRMGAAKDAKTTVTVSGGAWKIHPLIWKTYTKTLLEAYPELNIVMPAFEPAMYGVISYCLDQQDEITTEQWEALKNEFAQLKLPDLAAERRG